MGGLLGNSNIILWATYIYMVARYIKLMKKYKIACRNMAVRELRSTLLRNANFVQVYIHCRLFLSLSISD